MLPSHKVKPEGIAFAAPDHIIIIPAGMDTIPVRFEPSIAGNVPVIFAAGMFVKDAPEPLNVLAVSVPAAVMFPVLPLIDKRLLKPATVD